MKSGRVISLLGLGIYSVLALNQFEIFSVHQSILGFMEIGSTIFTVYVAGVTILCFLCIFLFKILNTMITKDPNKGSEMDNKVLKEGAKIDTKIDLLLIILILTLILAALTFHYTLAVYILLGVFVANSFKKEALKLSEVIEKSKKETTITKD